MNFFTHLLYLYSRLMFYKIWAYILETLKESFGTRFHKLFMFLSIDLIVSEEAELSVIDEILWSLKDGKWHNLEEITEKCSLPEHKVKMVLSFFHESGFVQVDENGAKVRLSPLTLEFVNSIQSFEREEALDHDVFDNVGRTFQLSY